MESQEDKMKNEYISSQGLDKFAEKFYSSINNNGLNYFIKYNEIIKGEKVVGEGAFGVVFLGLWQGLPVAIKKLAINSPKNNKSVLNKFIKEINIISSLSHPNILLYIGASVDKENYYLLTEYLSNGSLFKYIHRDKKKFSDRKKVSIAFQIASGIKYIHSRGIVHCDLKSSNVLLDEHFNAKLSDFGLSYYISEMPNNKKLFGTYRWMAPEVLSGKKHSFKSDIFSYGMILLELLKEKIPYSDMNNVSRLVDFIRREKEKAIELVPEEGNPILVYITKNCLRYDPKDRISIDKILELLQKANEFYEENDNVTEEIYDFIF